MAFESAPASFGGTNTPLMPSSITSLVAGISVQITGRPAAIASSSEMGKPSKMDGSTKRSASANNAGTSFRLPNK